MGCGGGTSELGVSWSQFGTFLLDAFNGLFEHQTFFIDPFETATERAQKAYAKQMFDSK